MQLIALALPYTGNLSACNLRLLHYIGSDVLRTLKKWHTAGLDPMTCQLADLGPMHAHTGAQAPVAKARQLPGTWRKDSGTFTSMHCLLASWQVY